MLNSLTAPAVTAAGVKRLFEATRPTRLTGNATLFDAGYEQAKRDFRERLIQEVGRPVDDIQTPEAAAIKTPPEDTLPGWWGRWGRR